MEQSSGDRQIALLDALAALEAEAARLFARRVDLLVSLDAAAAATQRETGREQFTVLELAGTCGLGQGHARDLLADAARWTECLPATLALLRTGQLLVHQAQVLFQVTENCPAPVCHTVEAQVLAALGADPAGIEGTCPADLRKTARQTLLTVEAQEGPAAVADREATARAGRRVWTRPDLDGMGIAGALLPAEQLAAWARDLDLLARAERTADRAAGVVRTADQRRADLFAALPGMVRALQAGDTAGGAPGVSARPVPVLINVLVPMDTVLDLTSTPGQVDGFGPVSAEQVRRLLPTAALRRVAVDAKTGRPLALDEQTLPAPASRPRKRPVDARSSAAPTATARVGAGTVDPQNVSGMVAARTAAETRAALLAMITPMTVVDRAEPQHDASAALGRLVDLRDSRCSGPGCSARAGLTDRDHNQPWPEGPTAAWNLVVRSRRCHRAKHTGWHPQQNPDGSTTWTSPLGRTYTRSSPHQPPGPLPENAALPPPRHPTEPIPSCSEPDDDEPWLDVAPVTKQAEGRRLPAADDDPPPF
jgi:Domain of unknown function (DUF222)